MRIVCISDTHNMHEDIEDVPDGDVLVHAGDCLGRGSIFELEDFNYWLGQLPHAHKVLVAGNHDWCFQYHGERARELLTNAIYLEDSAIAVGGLKFWGSPVTPAFRNWAFNRERGADIAKHWALIEPDTDVLITHGPPKGILDTVAGSESGLEVGCQDLHERISQLDIKAHIFGHIHESYGIHTRDGVVFVNASTCNRYYQPINQPIVINV